jgi:CheY-like chemotaxis protein
VPLGLICPLFNQPSDFSAMKQQKSLRGQNCGRASQNKSRYQWTAKYQPSKTFCWSKTIRWMWNSPLAALEENHFANKVAVVPDGEQALDYLYHRGKFEMRRHGNPLIVFLDHRLPKITGLEVLKITKSDEELRLIPVVALTSSREQSDLAQFYKYGVNAYA